MNVFLGTRELINFQCYQTLASAAFPEKGAALTALLCVGVAAPEACDMNSGPFSSVSVSRLTLGFVAVAPVSRARPCVLQCLSTSSPHSAIAQSQPLLPNRCASVWSICCSFPKRQSCVAPVNAGTHPASSISLQLAVQQLPGSLAPFHLCFSCRPVELCTASRNVLWYVETSGLFFLFFLLLTSK